MWSKYAVVFLLISSVLADLYNAGRYSSGWREVREGKGWAVSHIIAAIIEGFLAIALYFGW